MSKLKSAISIIKFIILTMFDILKFAVTLVPRLFVMLYKHINKRLRFSITFKTTAIYTLVFSSLLFIIGTALIAALYFFLVSETEDSLVKNSKAVISFINESESIPEEKIEKYAALEDISVILLNEEMRVIYSTTGNNDYTTPRKDIRLNSTVSIDLGKNIKLSVDAKLRYNIHHIQITRLLDKEYLYFGIMVAGLIACFIIAVLLTVIIGSITSRRMLRPIHQITHKAQSISVGALDTRLGVVDTHDELKEMAETFNGMLDRIQASYEQQIRFVSDASHELRTPISVIQGYANLLHRWGKEDKQVMEESIDAIKSEADSMKELVEKLLFLARADKNRQKLEKSIFSLNELMNEVIKETKLIDSEHEISIDRNGMINLQGDKGLIKQALRILIDNSIKYTPTDGTIRVCSCQAGARAVITVEDNGIGISKEDLPHIFDRFYKCDKSRTRESSSTGLGLSIVKWIVEKHEGNIKVESEINKGTKIMINLPVIAI